MKRSLNLFCLLLSCLIVPGAMVKAQATAGAADGRVAMLKEFYTAYITTFATTLDDRKLVALRRKYCTDRLFKKVPDMIEKSDGDPFLKGQDSDTAFIRTLSITKDAHKEGQYTVAYLPDKSIVIHLMVIEENKKYKIDNIW